MVLKARRDPRATADFFALLRCPLQGLPMKAKPIVLGAIFFYLLTPSLAAAEELTLPIDIGFGPAFHLFSGALEQEQTFHYGLRLSGAAVIDQATIKQYKNKIPKKYRGYIAKSKELRISKWYIPDTLFFSPKTQDTGIYGLVLRPLSLGIPLLYEPFRFSIGLGLDLAYAYIDADNYGTTHFFRPGLDLRVELEIPMSESFLISGGWTSQLYIPQKLGNSPFTWDFGEGDEIWHVGQIFAMLHFRFPYSVSF